ncbi:MAG: hypothetical protein CVU61_05080 [Deltaproteobacteria bacterium HGW-Deltaproteobacteria-19]|jgi:hypothetical protein|nr:MAG: hypothetical protein CVU61_05080 [Deltaproteobacteria bacterium HGW-Deltaproteobacteria-19]
MIQAHLDKIEERLKQSGTVKESDKAELPALLGMPRKLFISILITGFIAGSWLFSHAETYRCEAIPNQTADCTVDYNSTSDGPSTISCRPAGGTPPFEITCDIIYSPLPGYTWTGVKGYNWRCGNNIIVPDSAFQDKKSICDRMCGSCEGGWQ